MIELTLKKKELPKAAIVPIIACKALRDTWVTDEVNMLHRCDVQATEDDVCEYYIMSNVKHAIDKHDNRYVFCGMDDVSLHNLSSKTFINDRVVFDGDFALDQNGADVDSLRYELQLDKIRSNEVGTISSGKLDLQQNLGIGENLFRNKTVSVQFYLKVDDSINTRNAKFKLYINNELKATSRNVSMTLRDDRSIILSYNIPWIDNLKESITDPVYSIKIVATSDPLSHNCIKIESGNYSGGKNNYIIEYNDISHETGVLNIGSSGGAEDIFNVVEDINGHLRYTIDRSEDYKDWWYMGISLDVWDMSFNGGDENRYFVLLEPSKVEGSRITFVLSSEFMNIMTSKSGVYPFGLHINMFDKNELQFAK